MEKIGERAFEECSKLTDVLLSSQLKSIGIKAFAQTKIERLELPNCFQTVEPDAFQKCPCLGYLSANETFRQAVENAEIARQSMESDKPWPHIQNIIASTPQSN